LESLEVPTHGAVPSLAALEALTNTYGWKGRAVITLSLIKVVTWLHPLAQGKADIRVCFVVPADWLLEVGAALVTLSNTDRWKWGAIYR
jgi:hypothetical protein